MSIVKSSTFKQPECTNPLEDRVRDLLGGVFNFQIVGTDPDVSGTKTGASITALTGDYAPDSEHTNQGTFLICIETEGVFYVSLEDGSDFIISAEQSATYLGQWYPAKLMSVNVGTTGNFSVGY